MTTSQAINLLRPGSADLIGLRVAYKQAAKNYHPDLNPDGLEMMKIINEAYHFLLKNLGTWKITDQQESDENLAEEILNAFQKIRNLTGLTVEVCGTWLWVSGETKRNRDHLKTAKFRWSKNKLKWYWHPAGYRKKTRRKWDMENIRDKFGSQKMKCEPAASLQ